MDTSIGVLVYFENSPVKLPGLPMGWMNIEPATWTVTVKDIIDDSLRPRRIRFKRVQLPLQPAFAVTGHSAQGKTLLRIMADLIEGGHAAYVAASRATGRQGLFITQYVSLAHLNRRLHHDLVMELKRLDALSYNTLVRYGFCKGEYISVPSPETESKPIVYPRVSFDMPVKAKRVYKRKKSSMSINVPQTTPRINEFKRRRVLGKSAESHYNVPEQLEFFMDYAGCKWDLRDWSCAYDVIVMVLWNLVRCSSTNSRVHFSELTELSRNLSMLFDDLSQLPKVEHFRALNIIRDSWRDVISTTFPESFPRRGPALVSASLLLERTLTSSFLQRSIFTCADCVTSVPRVQLTSSLAFYCSSYLLRAMQLEDIQTVTTQHWLDAFFVQALTNADGCVGNGACGLRPVYINSHIFCITMYIESGIATCVNPTVYMDVNGERTIYELSSIIYHESNHFCAKLMEHGIVWDYDSAVNNGIPTRNGNNTYMSWALPAEGTRVPHHESGQTL
ncbi:hypothetical protein M422DRAFT_267163 [Sphaerobolus stellatus SS14]|uniref:Uncharacterized protein n=1 Tax=Sphaerobolus stellatus (strain SS14) TaxID=990650 RepID=A0A0C9U9K4_SPHS4|nr:hypothetical protein M422DRAFT_267163 [Sphaerobolus stellatus SS14]